jgi:hypothetical protein
MPIRGRTPKDCFDQFKDHVRPLVAGVLGAGIHVTFTTPRGGDGRHCDMQLGPHHVDYVALESRTFGKVYLAMAQDLISNPCEVGFQLTTAQYWYKIFDVQGGQVDEPLFRWERSPVEAGLRHCKHHFQIGKVPDGQRRRAIEVRLGKGALDLNRIHLPTGYVLMEHVFRFLISELDVTPASGNWERLLSDSEGKFFREFNSRTSPPMTS